MTGKLRVVCVGKLRERWQREACGEYIKRISRYASIDVYEARDMPDADPRAIDTEGREILRALDQRDYVVALAIDGKEMDSPGFAAFISHRWEAGGNIALVIGGSRGLSRDVYARADFTLSFSHMTFPHGLMRPLLLEQVYRALTILAGHPYHK